MRFLQRVERVFPSRPESLGTGYLGIFGESLGRLSRGLPAMTVTASTGEVLRAVGWGHLHRSGYFLEEAPKLVALVEGGDKTCLLWETGFEPVRRPAGPLTLVPGFMIGAEWVTPHGAPPSFP